MKKQIIAALIAGCLLAPSAALAHDASKHKGKGVRGEVVNISKDQLELKTETGTLAVTFSSKTKFEHGNATVDSTHVTKGAQISVFGTKLPTGEMVAKEVLIGGAEANAVKIKKPKTTPHQH